jgi:hypothetical protein
VQQDDEGSSMMHEASGWMGGWMWFWPVVGVLLVALLVVGISKSVKK